MFTLYLILIISVLSSARFSNYTESNNEVIVLDKNSIKDAINKSENIFINFYASWCRYSTLASPEFLKAAKKSLELKLPLTFAQIESTGQKKIFDLAGFPTYKLFRRGFSINYVGNRTSEHFIQWLQSHIRSVRTINTTEEAKRLIDSKDLLVIGFFKSDDSEKLGTFKNITLIFDKPVFALTFNEEIFDAYNVTEESIILFKKFDVDRSVIFTEEFTLNNVKNFIEIYSTPLLQVLNKDSIDTVYTQLSHVYQYALIVVSEKDNNKTNQVLQSARIFAREYNDKIKFLVLDVDKKYFAPILKLFYIVPEEVPSLVLIPNVFDRNSYKISGNLSFNNIKQFLQYFENRQLDDLLNEKLSNDWNKKPVYTLVRSIFLNVTHNLDKNVLVYFYVHNCNKCVKWEKIIEELGKTYESREDIIISKINVGLNSIDSKWYRGIPGIALFKKDTNKDVHYTGEINLEDLIKFIESAGVDEIKNKHE